MSDEKGNLFLGFKIKVFKESYTDEDLEEVKKIYFRKKKYMKIEFNMLTYCMI